MKSILITGCNRGLGLGLVKALNALPEPPQHLFTTCRNLEQATELQELAKKHSNIHILEIDLKNYGEYDKLVGQISAVTKDAGLNVLFNNAGMAPKSVRLAATREQDLISTLHTNTVAPIMLTRACLPLLKQASVTNEAELMGVRRAAIINMSSILGSIESNVEGGMYAYRTSKAALNAATKSMSIDLKPQSILCISMHPGWVRTDMGGGNAPLDVDTSTKQIVDTICQLNESHNGGFYQYDGAQLPW
ncbi:C-factor [Drosophila grimshawi]|uniref:GH11969 n=1 Tax=Drosophila grimshawi TaxID=7222 RepID=B4JKY1_DROGR|nr:C-factor [Drosophila grimshawi]XP_032594388.1 C-factor [Drosophila grimshawi]EDW00234.1 GH11969 [Drosophila grimshawi]